MGLSAEDNERFKALLEQAHVPAKFNRIPLSKSGVAGRVARSYLVDHYKEDVAEFRGAVFEGMPSGIAQSFTRDMIMGNPSASVHFYYLQTFANALSYEEAKPLSYVIEWFEQDNQPSPFEPRERFRLETDIGTMIDMGIRFYLFTAVPIRLSKWWSVQFVEKLLDNCRVVGASGNGNRQRNQRTSVINSKKSGQKIFTSSKRVTVR